MNIFIHFMQTELLSFVSFVGCYRQQSCSSQNSLNEYLIIYKTRNKNEIIQVMVLHTYLHKSIPKVDAISKIGASDVTVERCGIELSQHKYFVDATVDAIAHWNVYKPIAPPNRNLKNIGHKKASSQNTKMLGFQTTIMRIYIITYRRCRSSFGQRIEMCPWSSSQYNGNNILWISSYSHE